MVEDVEEKYVDKLSEFGQREAEWYLCAKDTKVPCIMEPYLYEISPGYFRNDDLTYGAYY